MSRQGTAAQRNLTLTEELEKLEQSITLTLQEIDHNFSRAHRIVTTSILPVVENYREHSTQVWEGSKFWKQFFEASANVSLSGYEESPQEESEVGGDEDEEDLTTTESARATPSSASYASPPMTQNGGDEEDEATITPMNNQYGTTAAVAAAGDYSPSPTPKAHATKTSKAPYSSPYESLKRATVGGSPSDTESPSTPHPQRASHSKSNPQRLPPHQQSSPFAPPSTYRHTSHRTPSHNDVLLHRVLDKTWRIQATPHSTARLPYRGTAASGEDSQQFSPTKLNSARKSAQARHNQQQQGDLTRGNHSSDDLDSSPAAPAPELHAEIFDTPARKGTVTKARDRVPGISVLTPAKGTTKHGAGTDKIGKEGPGPWGGKAGQAGGAAGNLWDSDDDEDDGDDDDGMSPPKTMQFHVPQSRLVRTPAREASKRIVEDLLSTAGMEDGLEDAEEEASPSIVKPGGGLLEEDTF